MPKGSPKYFEQIDPYGGRVSVDDPEFAAQVRAKIGDPYKDLVDPSQAQNIKNPKDAYTLLGTRYRKDTTPEQRVADAKLSGLGAIDPNKPVMGIGAGASPATFAHEFRHEKVQDEKQNRLEDLMYANSQPQYARAIQSAYEELTGETGEKKSINEKEAYVLRMYEGRFPKGVDIVTHSVINNGASDPSMFNKTIELGYPRGAASKDTIKQRVKYPFLNWVGMSDLPNAGKYSSGGNIENTTHDRKLI